MIIPVPHIILLGLQPILILAFVYFYRLVKIESEMYRDQWIDDGKPLGDYFWKASLSTSFSTWFPTLRVSWSWLFKTPQWVRNDFKAKSLLRKWRITVLIWNVAIIVWFVISMTMYK